MRYRGILALGICLAQIASGCRTTPHAAAPAIESAAASDACSSEHAARPARASQPTWLVGVESQLAAREYWASPGGGELQAPNRAHDLRIFFAPSGIRVHERAAADTKLFAATWAGVGRSGAPLAAVPAGTLSSERERVEIRREGLVEWYVNSPKGLEQGFDVETPPPGEGDLVVEISLTAARAAEQGDDLVLRTDSGRRLSYGKLEARDAKGVLLAGRIDVPDPQRVRLVVEDAGATYPIAIDPLLSGSADAIVEADQASAELGIAVAGAGDVNADGYADVIVGAHKYDSGQTDEGAAFVYLGGSNGIPSGGPLSAPASMIQSDLAQARLGGSVAGAGDVNGDGFDDVIVAAHRYANGQTNEGSAFIFHGSATGIVASGNPLNANTRIEPNLANAFLGNVGSAGDVNGDGYDDVVVGANGYEVGIPSSVTDEGAVFVYLGQSGGIPNGTPLTAHAHLRGDQVGAYLSALSSPGDVNRDGYDDLLVGATGYDAGEQNEGIALVFHGSSAGITGTTPATADSLIQSNLAFTGAAGSLAMGDFNGDGYDDVAVGGGGYYNPEANEGGVFVYLGGVDGIGDGDWSTADAVFESNQAGAFLSVVASAGDAAGDGADDLLIGAYLYDNGLLNEGGAFLFLGDTDSFSGGDLSDAVGALEGNQTGANLGLAVAGAGDVNADGSDDVVVSAHLYDNGQSNEGAAFVLHGDPRPPFEPDDLRVIDGDDDVTLTWTAPGANIDRYIVHRYGTDGEYQFFVLNGDATSFVDASPPPTGVSFYWVQAVNGRSQVGPFVQCGVAPGTKGWATGALGPLPNPWFTASVSGDDVTLHWEKSSVGTVTGYNIYASTTTVPLGSTSGLSNVANVSGLTTTTHQLTNLSPGTYYFRITALIASPATESNLASARQVAVVVN